MAMPFNLVIKIIAFLQLSNPKVMTMFSAAGLPDFYSDFRKRF
jgi:hypothetical protein